MWLFKREAIRKFFHFFSPDGGRVEVEELPGLRSAWLKREVRVRVLLPPGYAESSRSYPLLVLNDGQDLEALRFVRVLERLYRKGKVGHFIAVAVHAGDRMQEYGTAGHHCLHRIKNRGFTPIGNHTNAKKQNVYPL